MNSFPQWLIELLLIFYVEGGIKFINNKSKPSRWNIQEYNEFLKKNHRFNAIMQYFNVSYTHLLLLNKNKFSVINVCTQMKIITIFFTDICYIT